jgi:hypothetical protein
MNEAKLWFFKETIEKIPYYLIFYFIIDICKEEGFVGKQRSKNMLCLQQV